MILMNLTYVGRLITTFAANHFECAQMLLKLVKFYFKSYYRFELDLTGLDETLFRSKFDYRLPKGFSFKKLEKEDFELFDSDDYPEAQLKSKHDRLCSPFWKCFAVINNENEELAYSSWINSSKRYYQKEFEREFVHDGSKVLFEADHTMPNYRGIGLHSYCMLERILYAKRKGFKTVMINIHVRNIPALRTVEKFGFKRVLIIPLAFRKGSLSYTWNRLKGFLT